MVLVKRKPPISLLAAALVLAICTQAPAQELEPKQVQVQVQVQEQLSPAAGDQPPVPNGAGAPQASATEGLAEQAQNPICSAMRRSGPRSSCSSQPGSTPQLA